MIIFTWNYQFLNSKRLQWKSITTKLMANLRVRYLRCSRVCRSSYESFTILKSGCSNFLIRKIKKEDHVIMASCYHGIQ